MGKRLVKNGKKYLKIEKDERKIVERNFDTLVEEIIDDEYVKKNLIKNKDNMVDNIIELVSSLKTTKEEVLERINKAFVEILRLDMLQKGREYFNDFDEKIALPIIDEYVAKEFVVYEAIRVTFENMMRIANTLKSNGEKLEDICNIKIPNAKKRKRKVARG